MEKKHGHGEILSSLVPLFCLGVLGGSLLEGTEGLLRLRGYDQGLKPESLDYFSFLDFIIGILKIIWIPLFARHLQIGSAFGYQAWLVLLTCAMGWIFFSCSQSGCFSTPFLSLLYGIRHSFDVIVISAQTTCFPQFLGRFREITCIQGYRMGMALAGSLGFFCSTQGITWPWIYKSFAFCLWIVSCLLYRYPQFFLVNKHVDTRTLKHEPRAQGTIPALKVWFQQHHAGRLTLFLFLYRLHDGIMDPQRDIMMLRLGLEKNMVVWMKMGGGLIFFVGCCLSGLMGKQCSDRAVLTWGMVTHGLCFGLWGLFFISPSLWASLIMVAEQGVRAFILMRFLSFQLILPKEKSLLTHLSWILIISDLGPRLIGMRSGWILSVLGVRSTILMCAMLAVGLSVLTFWSLKEIQSENQT